MWLKVLLILSVALVSVKTKAKKKDAYGHLVGKGWYFIASYGPKSKETHCYKYTISLPYLAITCEESCKSNRWYLLALHWEANSADNSSLAEFDTKSNITNQDSGLPSEKIVLWETKKVMMAIRRSSDLEKAMERNCWCNFEDRKLDVDIIRALDKKHFLIYEKNADPYDNSMYRISLLSKGKPALEELKDIEGVVPELLLMRRHLYCDLGTIWDTEVKYKLKNKAKSILIPTGLPV